MAEQARAGWAGPGAVRMIVAVVQAVLLYWLINAEEAKAWPSTDKALYAPLVLASAYVPLVLLAGVGRMRAVALGIWAVLAAGLVAGVAWWSVVRDGGELAPFGGPPAAVFVAAALFIAHHLIEGALVARRPIAPYPVYFDTAWKHGVQLVLAVAFAGVFWLLLFLGAALFQLIGLKFFQELIRHDWFAIPATTLTFAAAVHLTDVRAGILKGVRTVALTLLAWLMPLMGLIAAGFLVALPFTGLKPLWETGNATALLLAASAALIVLLNAAYQDGEDDTRAPVILRWAGRVTALALTPMAALVAYGLWLRIGQHGLTPDRVIASACALVAVGYAVGYAIAALRPGPWLKPLEPTNVVMAVVAFALICALFSPLADPARLSVADQLARLQAGKIAADKFDYAFLRFDGAKWGRQELERMAKGGAGPNAAAIAEKAKAAQALENKWAVRHPAPPKSIDLKRVTVWPKGRALPDSFVKQTWSPGMTGFRSPCLYDDVACDAFFADFDGDGVEEVLLSPGYELSVYRLEGGVWTHLAQLSTGGCEGVLEGLKAGQGKLVEPRWKDLEVGGQRLRLGDERCVRGPPNAVLREVR